MINIPVGVGELIDKITILQIKRSHISNPLQRINIDKELSLLLDAGRDILPLLGDLINKLSFINSELWAVEDKIRACEREEDFGPAFVNLARHVYILNDERSIVKKQINQLTKSELTEEKSYTTYTRE